MADYYILREEQSGSQNAKISDLTGVSGTLSGDDDTECIPIALKQTGKTYRTGPTGLIKRLKDREKPIEGDEYVPLVLENGNAKKTRARTIWSGEWINVKDYGARGDGNDQDVPKIEEETKAILRAIAEATNRAKRTDPKDRIRAAIVYFPPGIYVYYLTLAILYSHIRLVGEGRGNTKIVHMPDKHPNFDTNDPNSLYSQNAVSFTNPLGNEYYNHCGIQGMIITGNKYTKHGLHVGHQKKFHASDLYIIGGESGICVENNEISRFEEMQVQATKPQPTAGGLPGAAVIVRNSSNAVYFQNAWIRASGDGARVQSHAYFINCMISGNKVAAIRADGPTSVFQCHFENSEGPILLQRSIDKKTAPDYSPPRIRLVDSLLLGPHADKSKIKYLIDVEYCELGIQRCRVPGDPDNRRYEYFIRMPDENEHAKVIDGMRVWIDRLFIKYEQKLDDPSDIIVGHQQGFVSKERSRALRVDNLPFFGKGTRSEDRTRYSIDLNAGGAKVIDVNGKVAVNSPKDGTYTRGQELNIVVYNHQQTSGQLTFPREFYLNAGRYKTVSENALIVEPGQVFGMSFLYQDSIKVLVLRSGNLIQYLPELYGKQVVLVASVDGPLPGIVLSQIKGVLLRHSTIETSSGSTDSVVYVACEESGDTARGNPLWTRVEYGSLSATLSSASGCWVDSSGPPVLAQNEIYTVWVPPFVDVKDKATFNIQYGQTARVAPYLNNTVVNLPATTLLDIGKTVTVISREILQVGVYGYQVVVNPSGSDYIWPTHKYGSRCGMDEYEFVTLMVARPGEWVVTSSHRVPRPQP
jgi:hypothetical protein